MALDENNNPITTPEAFDRPLLDDKPFPGGKTEITSGGSAKDKIEGMQALGQVGATTVDRGEELGEVSYDVFAFTVDQFRELGAWLDMLRQGRKRRPRKTYRFLDPRISHNGYDQVIPKEIGAIAKVSQGLWKVALTVAEWKRRKTAGGPVRPTDPRLAQARAEEEAASRELAEAQRRAADALAKAEQRGG